MTEGSYPQVILPITLGEQKPLGPQSASTRQLLPAAQKLVSKLDAELRHSHGWPPGQSESLKHVS